MTSSAAKIEFAGREIDYTPPWPRRKYADLYREHVGLDMSNVAAGRARVRELKLADEAKLDDALVLAELGDAKARRELAQTISARNATLAKSRNVSQTVADQARTDLALAESAVALAEVQLSKLTIRAPFDGRLGFRSISEGAYVQAGNPLVHLEKIDKLKAAFSIPELYLTRLEIGQTVSVATDAAPSESADAVITAIDPLVDEASRSIRVRASFDNSTARMRPGMLARIAIKGQAREAVMVPEAAIVPNAGSAALFVADGEKARSVTVKTGRRIDGLVEIVDGLSGAEKVVVAGANRLQDGAAIAVTPAAN
ncbi:MAG: efflux RND transporter periplasmic adaptor subunit [Rhodospirillales bacterium]|nr:efflux RND transporter periplasmic adaptor subunit [Rhodospirillales bacterium]